MAYSGVSCKEGDSAHLLERQYPELSSLYLGDEVGGQTTSGSPLGFLGELRDTPGLLPGEETTRMPDFTVLG